jgi:two-component sensor histidine kinase
MTIREGAKFLSVGLAYFAIAYLGLQLASLNPSATPIWPATGLAIATTLLWGYRVTPAIFVAAFLVNQLTAGSVFTSFAIAVGNTLEATVAVYFMRAWGNGDQTFETPTGVAKFALICLAATAISATIGVGSLFLGDYVAANNLVPVWLTWWMGDLAGALVVAPVILLWARSAPDQLTKTSITFLAAAAVGVIAFSPLMYQTPARDPLGFLAILPLLWAALRRGPRDTATVALILASFAVWGTMAQGGPFARSNLNDSFLLLLMFVISTAVPSLVLSADVAERQRAQDQERLLLRELSHRVGNTLAVLQSIFRRSVRHARSVEDLEAAFEGRLMNLAATHTLLSETTWHSALLGDLIRAAVKPYCAEDFRDCWFSGGEIRVPGASVLSFTMVLHELATNAAKHGAFRKKGGELKVSWHEETGSAGLRIAVIDWRELGPVHNESNRPSGYGTTLIDSTLSALGGHIDREFTATGVRIEIRFPIQFGGEKS